MRNDIAGRDLCEAVIRWTVVRIKQVVDVAEIGHEQVDIAVIVKVAPVAAGRGCAIANDGAARYLGKSAIAIVQVQKVVLVKIGDKEIKIAITIKVDPIAGR